MPFTDIQLKQIKQLYRQILHENIIDVVDGPYEPTIIYGLFENTFKVDGHSENIEHAVKILNYLALGPNTLLLIIKKYLYSATSSGQVIISGDILFEAMCKKLIFNLEDANLAFLLLWVKSLDFFKVNMDDVKNNWQLPMVVRGLKSFAAQDLTIKAQQWIVIMDYLAEFNPGTLEHVFHDHIIKLLKSQYYYEPEILAEFNISVNSLSKKLSSLNLGLLFSRCMSNEDDIEETQNFGRAKGSAATPKLAFYN